MTNSVLKCR